MSSSSCAVSESRKDTLSFFAQHSPLRVRSVHSVLPWLGALGVSSSDAALPIQWASRDKVKVVADSFKARLNNTAVNPPVKSAKTRNFQNAQGAYVARQRKASTEADNARFRDFLALNPTAVESFRRALLEDPRRWRFEDIRRVDIAEQADRVVQNVLYWAYDLDTGLVCSNMLERMSRRATKFASSVASFLGSSNVSNSFNINWRFADGVSVSAWAMLFAYAAHLQEQDEHTCEEACEEAEAAAEVAEVAEADATADADAEAGANVCAAAEAAEAVEAEPAPVPVPVPAPEDAEADANAEAKVEAEAETESAAQAAQAAQAEAEEANAEAAKVEAETEIAAQEAAQAKEAKEAKADARAATKAAAKQAREIRQWQAKAVRIALQKEAERTASLRRQEQARLAEQRTLDAARELALLEQRRQDERRKRLLRAQDDIRFVRETLDSSRVSVVSSPVANVLSSPPPASSAVPEAPSSAPAASAPAASAPGFAPSLATSTAAGQNAVNANGHNGDNGDDDDKGDNVTHADADADTKDASEEAAKEADTDTDAEAISQSKFCCVLFARSARSLTNAYAALMRAHLRMLTFVPNEAETALPSPSLFKPFELGFTTPGSSTAPASEFSTSSTPLPSTPLPSDSLPSALLPSDPPPSAFSHNEICVERRPRTLQEHWHVYLEALVLLHTVVPRTVGMLEKGRLQSASSYLMLARMRLMSDTNICVAVAGVRDALLASRAVSVRPKVAEQMQSAFKIIYDAAARALILLSTTAQFCDQLVLVLTHELCAELHTSRAIGVLSKEAVEAMYGSNFQLDGWVLENALCILYSLSRSTSGDTVSSLSPTNAALISMQSTNRSLNMSFFLAREMGAATTGFEDGDDCINVTQAETVRAKCYLTMLGVCVPDAAAQMSDSVRSLIQLSLCARDRVVRPYSQDESQKKFICDTETSVYSQVRGLDKRLLLWVRLSSKDSVFANALITLAQWPDWKGGSRVCERTFSESLSASPSTFPSATSSTTSSASDLESESTRTAFASSRDAEATRRVFLVRCCCVVCIVCIV